VRKAGVELHAAADRELALLRSPAAERARLGALLVPGGAVYLELIGKCESPIIRDPSQPVRAKEETMIAHPP
jgi:hypothetical protein